ncbi:acetate--CoA ligase family protein [Mesorhizobium sp. B2-4-6]|uniref:acetate--CoA ligase family protein n=1 Tax=Mesorhizobium sp. B2-4-6 TaxID=2589943 RepID=UPI00112A4231|nr:acetate--CoA ligase family protein [Mesorhizobium sp. B2-4-6]TPL43516.1 acetate--CoA ligase family protein [Mesorhizobium sp. B2-4-6]
MSPAPDLRPLFRPRSIAIFGASARPGRPGCDIIAAASLLGPAPRLYPITPRYDTILGIPCLPDAAALPETVDLAVIASGSARILADAAAAIEAGAKALHVLGDLDTGDCDALGRMAAEHGVALLGPNSVGFVNYAGKSLSTWIAPPEGQRTSGSIALILQSGALFSYANAVDPRLSFSLTVQPGREAGVTLSDALIHALAMPETRVVGIYLETVADPSRFLEGLAEAERGGIPVVVLAPGRSPLAAIAIATHARRLAGSTAGLEAVFRRHGVIATASLDQFWCTLRLMSAGLHLGPGGLCVVTDSGAQRAMTIDVAKREGVPLSNFSPLTEARLRAILAADLEPQNPLDMWGGEEDLPRHVSDCLTAALEDPDSAIGLVLTEFGVSDDDTFPTRMADGAVAAAKRASKPILAASFSTRHFSPARILRMEQAGLRVLDGLETSLTALAHLFAWRDRPSWPQVEPMPAETRQRIASALDALRPADENAALDILALAGLPTVDRHLVVSAEQAERAAAEFGMPVVLKSAEALLHKTEADGVVLDLRDGPAVRAAYDDLAHRLGPRALVAPMVRGGIELALGALVDPVFGPIVMVGAGGTAAEILSDRRFALAPVSEAEALAMIASLRVSPLLDPLRGKPGIDRHAVAKAVSELSVLVAAFPERICEIDVNPLIATPYGSTAVDAVILPANSMDDPR